MTTKTKSCAENATPALAPTILVVDDNSTNLKLASDVLEYAGYHVLKAMDAEEAQVVPFEKGRPAGPPENGQGRAKVPRAPAACQASLTPRVRPRASAEKVEHETRDLAKGLEHTLSRHGDRLDHRFSLDPQLQGKVVELAVREAPQAPGRVGRHDLRPIENHQLRNS